MIPQRIKCWIGLHDWFYWWFGRMRRRRCIACRTIQQRAAYPGEHWYRMDKTGTYRLHN